MSTQIFEEISTALQAGKKNDVETLVQQAIDEGYSAQEILDGGLMDGMNIIGAKFSNNEIFVPEMMVAALAMNVGTQTLKPLMIEQKTEPVGKAVIGTVKGDLHDIGKNLVRMMIEAKGIEIDDLGVDVPADTFVNYVKEHEDLDLLCLSALLTTTLPSLRDAVAAVREACPDSRVKILVGGAPVTQEFADEIGADGYTADAGAAAVAALELVKAKKAAE